MNTITTQLPFNGVMTSNIGGRKENQDTCGYSETPLGLLLVVCDGMGGGPGGKTASSIAATTIIGYIQRAGIAPEGGEAPKVDNETLLREAVKAANSALRDKIAEVPELEGMGTTVTALLLTPREAAVAHVGDSRIFQLRDGKMVFRTADHSRVAEMVRAGVLTEEQARQSSISNLITRALGVGPDVEVDTSTLSYEKGDRFVLCSDGVWGSMPQPELILAFTDNESPQTTAEILNVRVEDIGIEKGGRHDNFTMVIVDTENASEGVPPQIPPVTRPKKTPPPVLEGAPSRKGMNPKLLALLITGIIVTVLVVALLLINPFSLLDEEKVDETVTVEQIVGNNEENGNEAETVDNGSVTKDEQATSDVKAAQQPEEATQENVPAEPQAPAQTAESPAQAPEPAPADVSTPDNAALKARVEALTIILKDLDTLRAYIDAMNSNSQSSAARAKATYENNKNEALKLLSSLEKVDGYEYSADERRMLFDDLDDAQLKSENRFNGLVGAINAKADTGNFNIMIQRLNNLKKSLGEKLEAAKAELNK